MNHPIFISLILLILVPMGACKDSPVPPDSTEKETAPKATNKVEKATNSPEVAFEKIDPESEEGKKRFSLPILPENPRIGPEDAPVTMVLFAGYQCPYSKRLPPVIDALVQAYPNELQVVFKHAPLPHHKRGLKAAEKLATLSGEDFWKASNALFALDEWNGEQLDAVYQNAGGSPTEWEANKEKAKATIQHDIALAQKHAVRGTPQLFINGRRLTGVQPLEIYITRINAELEGKESPTEAPK